MFYNNSFIIPSKKDRIKRYFFIDYENVHEAGLGGLTELTSRDFVIIYYSQLVNNLSFDLHRAIIETPAKVEIIKVQNGTKNALDFQLSSNLGYFINFNLVAGNKKCKYYIVSADNGYCCLIPFWKDFGAEVCVSGSLQNIINPQKNISASSFSSALRSIGLTEQEELLVSGFLEANLRGADLHDALQKNIKTPGRASEIYRSLKKILTPDDRSKKAAIQ